MALDLAPGGDLKEALAAAGWTYLGGKRLNYSRWGSPHSVHFVVVPEDPSAPDYDELRAAAIRTLTNLILEGKTAKKVLDSLKRSAK